MYENRVKAWRQRGAHAPGLVAAGLGLALAAGLLAGCAGSGGEPLGSVTAPGGAAQTALGSAQPGALAVAGAAPAAADPATKLVSAQADGSGKASTDTTVKQVAYKIGPQDILDITVFKVPELTKSVEVSDAGTINLPLVGELDVGDKTPHEVEKDLTKKLGKKYLREPQVTVLIKEYNSQRVTVEGGVKKPGVYPVKGRNTLLQYVAMAEGLDENSDNTAVIFRNGDGGRKQLTYDLSEISAGTTPDPAVQSGDVVVVGKSAAKEVFNNLLKAVPVATLFHL